MPTFQYEAMDNTGLEVKDTVEAATEQEAQRAIKEKGFYITKITEQGRMRDKKKSAPKKKSNKAQKTFAIGGVRGKQLTTFTRQLSTLQDAGLPILRSLRILEGQCRPGPLKNALIDVVEEIESGSTLSEAMAKQPKAFDNLYVNMVKAGEAGGALEIILQRLADFKEKAQTLKRKVIGAMIYPAVVITVAIVIVTGIMYFIIPEFKNLFNDFDLELPWLTIMLISCSDWVVDNWFLIPMIPIAFWLFIKIVKKNKTGAYICDFLSLKFPLLGGILRKATIARTMRTLGTLIASGVPILEALIIARDTSGNAVFRRAFDNIYAAIREGESMAIPLREARITDDMVVNMVDVGEETGALDTMLYKVADVYEEEVEVAVESLISILEPIMVVVLGVIVGTIVIALFMPMIALINSLSG
ncbi:Putative type II secretion system protein F [Polystyrenella longa]|uniref:Type II secretion system protein F n=1 Tax=Polystyrenella longa TaxID=2528007 RepID=A0A518CRF3_9PLAN|nr:type II secretion system F family protein [Polystyrenella longa]QDU81811.1 Putative type II secretion system protein F [Polystyrenella longa]